MKKEFNQFMNSIDIRSDNLKEERDLNDAVRLGILEKVEYGVWRLRV